MPEDGDTLSDDGGTIDVPSAAEVADALDQNSVGDRVYDDLVSLIRVLNDYSHPIPFEYAHFRAYHDYGFSRPPDHDRANDRLKDRLDRLGRWNPETVHRVVGRIPEASVWLDAVRAKRGLDPVSSANMNEVQQACVSVSDEREALYREATGRELQERALEAAGVASLSAETVGELVDGLSRSDSLPSDADSVGQVVDSVVHDMVELAISELPDREKSRSQGTKSSGGRTNELIVHRVLQSEGLRPESESSGPPCFAESESDDADVLVESAHGQLSVEVKSSNLRERGRRAIGDDGEWVIIGFFDEASEVRNDVLEGNEQG
ncbi:MAG: hypothetical protein ABEI99_00850, partial [Halobaculum sp.]